MRLALTLSAALMATGAMAFVPAMPSARPRSMKLVSGEDLGTGCVGGWMIFTYPWIDSR